jgi:hypothetical protein
MNEQTNTTKKLTFTKTVKTIWRFSFGLLGGLFRSIFRMMDKQDAYTVNTRRTESQVRIDNNTGKKWLRNK